MAGVPLGFSTQDTENTRSQLIMHCFYFYVPNSQYTLIKTNALRLPILLRWTWRQPVNTFGMKKLLVESLTTPLL